MREVFTEMPDVTWDDVGGLDDAKAALSEAVEWPLRYADLFDALGAAPPRGILLDGPPGTGKTLLAKARRARERRQLHLGQGAGAALQVGRRIRARRARGLQEGARRRPLHRLLRRDRRPGARARRLRLRGEPRWSASS